MVYADALQGEPLDFLDPDAVKAIADLSELLRTGGDADTAAALRERFGCDTEYFAAALADEVDR